MKIRFNFYLFILLILGMAQSAMAQTPADPLPSWNEGDSKKSILEFVTKATSEGDANFIPQVSRIAVFDNDGTLWAEQPIYVQFAFAIDRVKALAEKHHEWKTTPPFQFILQGDMKSLSATGEKGMVEVIAATHAGMTTDEFDSIVQSWLTTARHPTLHKPYTALIYQPMLELLAYLRANGFKTYIVSGGGIEFVRVFSEKIYGIPPEQVIGSSIKIKFEFRDGKPVLMRLPEIDLIDDKEDKPVGIHKFIGRRPVFAAGNSDGDLQMLQWTTTGNGSRFGLIIHHTDAKREWAYDRHSAVGRLDKAWDEANAKGWTVVDMKKDWKVIYPPTEQAEPQSAVVVFGGKGGLP